MAILSFKVQADYEKVVKLREEITKLEAQLKSFGRNTPLNEIKAVESRLAEVKAEFTAVATEAAETGAMVSSATSKMAKGMAGLFSVQMAAEFTTQVAQVRGEFQKLEIAFETMLQSKEKADALMAQIVDTAARTPFDLQGVAGGAKQLLAYGVASEQVNDTLIRLGDIASGLSIPLGDLVYLYGTTMAQGRMFTMDLRQFQGRGIPMTEELAKVMGVAKNEVAGLVTAGKIGFAEMEQAIKNMTSEGGKFAGLMEKQSKTITGQISNLEDAVDQMFNEIGQASEGAISGAIGAVSNLVENYKEVGEIIAGIALTVGTYKAALAAFSAANAASIKVEKDMLLSLLAVKAQDAAMDNANVATSGRVVAANNAEIVSLRQELDAKIKTLNASLLAAKGEEAAARTKVERLTVQLSLSKLQVKQAEKELAMAIATGNADAISAAQANLAAAAKQRLATRTELSAASKALEAAATNTETATSAVNTLQTNIETTAIDNQTRATLLLTAAKQKLVAVGRGIGKVLANPYVLAAASVAALGALVYKTIDALNVEDEAHENVTDAIKKHSEALNDVKVKGEELISTLKDEGATQMERVRAMEELRQLYPSLFKDMSDEEVLTMKQVEANKMLREETERLMEAELRRSLSEKKAALAKQEGSNLITAANGAIYNVDTSNSIQARRLRAEISEIESELEKLDALKKKAEFNALPKEAKIISLKQQIESLKNENLELDKQIAETNAKKWTIEDLGNLDFDFKASADVEVWYAKIEANRDRYEELMRELEKLEKEDTAGQTEKQKQANYNRKKAVSKAKEDLIKAERDLENKVSQSKINAMGEGFAREREQLKLNYKKQKEAYEKEQADLLKKLQENEKQKWLLEDPDNRKEYNFVPTITEDSPEYKKAAEQYARLGKDAVDAYNKSVENAEVKWVFANRQAAIDAMSEGAAKYAAQITLDNDKELYGLEQQREAYIENAKAMHMYAEERKKLSDPNHQVQAWGQEDEDNANAEFQGIVNATKKRQTERLLDEYKSYTDKKKDLDEQYELDKLELEKNYQETGDERFLRTLTERTKAYVQALNDLEREYGTEDYNLIFGDPSRMTGDAIEKALEKARIKLSQLNAESDPESFQALSEAIERLETARDTNPFRGWDTSVMGLVQKLYQIRNIRKDIAKYEKEGNSKALEGAKAEEEQAKKDLNNALIGTGVSAFAGGLASAAASMREVASASGDMDLAEQAEALERSASFVSSVASGAASGGWVGAIIGGATSLMDALVSSITESKVVAAEAKKAYEDYLDEIAHTSRSIKDEDYDTIFGVRSIEKVIDAIGKANDAWRAFEGIRDNQEGSKYSYQDNPWIIPTGLKEQLVWEGKKQNARNAYKVPTLAERFPNLFNEDNSINMDEAEAILSAYGQYSGEEWYEYLDDAYKALKDWEENLAVVDDHLSSLFQNVGSELADAIMQGNDALEALENSTGDIFAAIAKQLITELMFSDDFIKKYKEKWRTALATEDNMADEAQVAEEMANELEQSIHDAQMTWEQIKKIAEEKGIDMNLGDAISQQEATRKGYESLSEDTGNELVGRAIAQYESNLRMEEATRSMKESMDIMMANSVQIRDIAAESRAIIADSYLELLQIRDNTGNSAKALKAIDARMIEWDSKIKSL